MHRWEVHSAANMGGAECHKDARCRMQSAAKDEGDFMQIELGEI